MGYPESITRLIRHFTKLPGIGPRTAERLAFHVLRSDNDEAMALAEAIRDVVRKVKHCSECFNVSEEDPCATCGDPERDRSRLAVVEHPKDLQAIERTGYEGLYHVLLGRVSPGEGTTANDLTAEALKNRLQRHREIREVILATNPDLEGDGTALAIGQHLEGLGVKISRLARGVPTGTSLEHVNAAVLTEALSSRTEVSPRPSSSGAP